MDEYMVSVIFEKGYRDINQLNDKQDEVATVSPETARYIPASATLSSLFME